MNKEQIDFIKHCGEHFEVLTGGRGHSKTKEIVEKLQQENQHLKELVNGIREERDYLFNKLSFENQQLKDRINKAIEYINKNWDGSSYMDATLKNKIAELNISELEEILKEDYEIN